MSKQLQLKKKCIYEHEICQIKVKVTVDLRWNRYNSKLCSVCKLCLKKMLTLEDSRRLTHIPKLGSSR